MGKNQRKQQISRHWDFPGGLVVKTLPSNAGDMDLIPGRGAKIPHASGPKNQNIKQNQYCNKFNKAFKKMVHIKKKNLKKKRQCPQSFKSHIDRNYKIHMFKNNKYKINNNMRNKQQVTIIQDETQLRRKEC